MITVLNLLFPLFLSLTAPSPTPTAPTASAATTAPVKCVCQTIPFKQW